ncbi:G patch domain-containing protein 4-like [Palaemon carinicauda]|uniref:G patch domain-containing protein 4-like n=1 Tax=Palaemon carinicauda TaxID=392227 RepID=UPI0035B616FD
MSSFSNFGKSMLEKYGWAEGKGLGREEDGIAKAIKVNGNFSGIGLGHDVGKEFKNQWWDHVYNKTASNIMVAQSEDGSVKVERKGVQNTKKVIPFASAKSSQYSSFVKAGVEENIEEEEDMSLKLSYDELFKICGGKTAHKGARHGLTMSAKLARVKQQEEDLMAKWQQQTGDNPSTEADKLSIEKVKKSKKKKGFVADHGEDALPHEAADSCIESSELEKHSKKEKKNKRKKIDNAENENGTDVKDMPDIAIGVDCDVETNRRKLSKKERKLMSKMNDIGQSVGNENADGVKPKKKKKSRDGENLSDHERNSCSDEPTPNICNGEVENHSNVEGNTEKLNGEQETEEKNVDLNVAKYKKKKKRRTVECENGNSEDVPCIADTTSDNHGNETSESRLSKKERKRLNKLNNPLETDENEVEIKQKKKKKSKYKEEEIAGKLTEEENNDGDESPFDVNVSSKKKKSKKRSRSDNGVVEDPSESSQIENGSLAVGEDLGNESFKKKKKKCKREKQDK